MIQHTDTIRLYGRVFEILEVDRLDDLGACSWELGRICIRAGLSPYVRRSVLVHEIAHIVLMELGLDNLFDKTQVECVCDITAHVYAMIEDGRGNNDR